MSGVSALFVDIDFWPFGKISPNRAHSNPRKILTLGNKIKKSARGTF